MNRFKIEFVRSGVKHEPAYASTIQHAVKTARSKGFSNTDDSWTTTPKFARIYERSGGTGRNVVWELVATVTREDIRTEDFESRESIKDKQRQIAALQVEINDAHSTQLRLCRIADHEYAAKVTK